MITTARLPQPSHSMTDDGRLPVDPVDDTNQLVDEFDRHVRRHVYRRFVELGRAPALEEVAGELGAGRDEIEPSLRRLHDAHALVLEVLEQGAPAIRMAHPFSAIETAHRVRAAGRLWYANCAWDAFGIPAALGVDGHLSSRCACCDEPIAIDVVERAPVPDDSVVHLLLPARRWWDDIVFT
jgi:hypothetical protein